MTEQEIAALGPAFAAELRTYRHCFKQDRTAKHFDTYCRGLLADLPRKTVEPIALAAGTAVRTLQEFLVTAGWDHDAARDHLHRRLAAVADGLPAGNLGTVGVIDETSCAKKGDKTPGVQRQYLGCVGKIDNGVVTVHVGLARGDFRALLDADLYLPRSWADDRPRCRAAGIPDGVRYRSKWRVALDQLIRLGRNGVRFDWLVFDEGYGSKVPFLWVLGRLGQKFVAEVPHPAEDAGGSGVAGEGGAGVGGPGVAHAGDGGERGDGRGQVLRDERGPGVGRPGAGGGIPAGDGRARLPGGQARSRVDALRGPGLHRADPPPDAVADRARVRRGPHGAAAGGKIRG